MFSTYTLASATQPTTSLMQVLDVLPQGTYSRPTAHSSALFSICKGTGRPPWVLHLPPLLLLPIRHAITLAVVEVDATGAEFYEDNVGDGGVGRTKEPYILSS